jgi:hypothetical protein
MNDLEASMSIMDFRSSRSASAEGESEPRAPEIRDKVGDSVSRCPVLTSCSEGRR